MYDVYLIINDHSKIVRKILIKRV